MRDLLLADPFVREAVELFEHVTTAYVDIGSWNHSQRLADSGNSFSELDRVRLAAVGATGDIGLRFLDHEGQPFRSSLDDRVIAMSVDQLRRARVVAGAGGLAKGERDPSRTRFWPGQCAGQ